MMQPVLKAHASIILTELVSRYLFRLPKWICNGSISIMRCYFISSNSILLIKVFWLGAMSQFFLSLAYATSTIVVYS